MGWLLVASAVVLATAVVRAEDKYGRADAPGWLIALAAASLLAGGAVLSSASRTTGTFTGARGMLRLEGDALIVTVNDARSSWTGGHEEREVVRLQPSDLRSGWVEQGLYKNSDGIVLQLHDGRIVTAAIAAAGLATAQSMLAALGTDARSWRVRLARRQQLVFAVAGGLAVVAATLGYAYWSHAIADLETGATQRAPKGGRWKARANRSRQRARLTTRTSWSSLAPRGSSA